MLRPLVKYGAAGLHSAARPVTEFGEGLARAWNGEREVVWPLTILAARKRSLSEGGR